MSETAAIRAEITALRGSSPRGVGTFMTIHAATIEGTIGGGLLEWRAIQTARDMLSSGTHQQTLSMSLGDREGQCCGGAVTIELVRVDTSENNVRLPDDPLLGHVYILGAGPVGTAIAMACNLLPVWWSMHDERSHIEGRDPQGLPYDNSDNLCDIIQQAEEGSAFIVTTHAHALDFQLVSEVLRRGDAAYCGLIGSMTKRRKFEHGLAALGLSTAGLTCPIGDTSIVDKRPAVIAATTIPQIIDALASNGSRET